MNHHSNYTGRAHRSMTSAFGPYTNNVLHAPSERSQNWATILYAVILVATIALTLFVGVPQ